MAFEKAPSEVAKALKQKTLKVDSGFVFIDGKYLKPPYRITRYGNQILVNDRPVTGQLVPWEKFLETQSPSKLKTVEVEVKDEPSAPKKIPPAAAPEKDGDDPAAPKDGGNAPPPADSDETPPAADGEARIRVTIAPVRYAAGTDDLEDFDPNAESMKLTNIPKDSEEDKARQKRAEKEKEEEEEESKPAAPAAVDGEEVDPASPEGEAAAKAAAKELPKPAVKTRKVLSLDGAFEENARSRKLMKGIENVHSSIVTTLKRGGYVFFGTGARGSKPYLKGLRSDSVATKELLKKLPELMSNAKDPEAFCDTVRSAGLFSYITLQIAQDLYRNRTDFFELKQRRKAIGEEEKLHKMMNGNGR